MTETVQRQITSPIDSHGMPEGARDVLPSSNQGLEALKDITFGSVSHHYSSLDVPVASKAKKVRLTHWRDQTAGIIGKLIEYPFDTVKVRLQSQPNRNPPMYIGPIDCFRQSFRSDGFGGLYRGISAPLFGAAIETSSLFFSYRLAQNALQATLLPSTGGQPLPLGALAFCGAVSGAFTSLLLTPIELVKCKMQVPVASTSPYGPRPLSLIASVYRHQGFLGFWRGQLGTLIRETGGSAAWFGSYETVTALFRRFRPPPTDSTGLLCAAPSLPLWQQMLAGATAGMSYNFVFYPADTIKSRMQTEDISRLTRGARETFWAVGKELWREQGLKGLYRGCGITVARSAPSSAFIFAVYEGLREWYG